MNFNRPSFEQMMDDMSNGDIAVNDDMDTKYENSNELMPFDNLFNERRVRDCSRKVRKVMNAKVQRGIRVAHL
ncbi:MAG: hypothetical protein MSB10_03760 [Clostridiales bacterium]|nr:hypothetical protein [Clostridiales bacterium]